MKNFITNDKADNLKKLKANESGLQNKIAGFCEELGINKPFLIL